MAKAINLSTAGVRSTTGRAWLPWVRRGTFYLLLLLLWQGLAGSGIWPDYLFPGPLAVLNELVTGFQGGLQWYRTRTQGLYDAELQLFSGRTIDVPSMFIAGKSDWGTYQRPGNFERMQQSACTRMLGCHLIDGAGHWVQQEQPERVSELLIPGSSLVVSDEGLGRETGRMTEFIVLTR